MKSKCRAGNKCANGGATNQNGKIIAVVATLDAENKNENQYNYHNGCMLCGGSWMCEKE
jgi:hypothetical protein